MRTIYAICGAIGIIWGILYWTGVFEANAVVTGCYVFGWACMLLVEDLRR